MIFVAEVALLGTLEMIEEAVTFQEIEYSISPHQHCHRTMVWEFVVHEKFSIIFSRDLW